MLDRAYRSAVYMLSRQIGKSTNLGVECLSHATATPHWTSQYIAPSARQAAQWSATRAGKLIEYSPYIQENLVSSKLSMGVWRKEFTNGSALTVSYAYDDPDRTRGDTNDEVVFDEAQDIILDAVASVVKESTAASDYGYVIYAGTPKSMENSMQSLFEDSTQRVWVMKCGACGSWQYITRPESIGLRGPICVKRLTSGRTCGALLVPRQGCWHPLNLKPHGDPHAEPQMEGYHINQPAMAYNAEDPVRWARIVRKRDTYGEVQFLNEVLGVSVALGTRLVNEAILESCCRDYTVAEPPFPTSMTHDLLHDVLNVPEVYAGVDWGGEGRSHTSLTALWIWGVGRGNRLKALYFKTYPPGHPIGCVEDIARICNAARVKLVGADAGGGAHANAMLRMRLGDARVLSFQYGSFAQLFARSAQGVRVDRTAAIDTMMSLIRNGGIFLPQVSQSRPVFTHILSLFEEVTKGGQGTRIWNKTPKKVDDLLHAMVFGHLAAKAGLGEMQLYDLPSYVPVGEAGLVIPSALRDLDDEDDDD